MLGSVMPLGGLRTDSSHQWRSPRHGLHSRQQLFAAEREALYSFVFMLVVHPMHSRCTKTDTNVFNNLKAYLA